MAWGIRLIEDGETKKKPFVSNICGVRSSDQFCSLPIDEWRFASYTAPMVLGYDNYRTYLKAELAERVSANESYSLRAFAQKLGLSSSFLSEVLQGKKSLSGDAALKVALHLDLNEVEARYFTLLVQLESEKNLNHREALQQKLKELNPNRKTMDLSVDVFRTISDWYHLAILELTYLSGFVLTPSSAASRLGISETLARAAIERLLRLELLESGKDGKLKKSRDYVLAQSQIPNSAMKSFHAQLLDKAKTALQEQTPQERVSSTDMIPIDPKYIPEARRLSDQFTSGVLKLAEKSKSKHHVYCLSVHFFNLTHSTRGSS